MDEYDYSEDDDDSFPGVNRLNNSAYILSQGEIDVCIDFRDGKSEILHTIQRSYSVSVIKLTIEQWLYILFSSVGDPSFWVEFLWVKKKKRYDLKNYEGLTGIWEVLYPDVQDYLQSIKK